eukprot:Protomagalhaensia_sp_Gyna_25__5938@NODE_910_length_2431_cov_269_025920_g717_i0_p1_GENE_NODE_910_length_2431_cov_269_025920_g717_i0NODE_910_length_2431_cov_269_025920_g717_i0_p1_ORF_typecomplete_len704_score111_69Glyco_hydro_18/PF00704_28/6_9e51DUF4849/PF16141_5/0_11DUF4849/PF16141_5/2_8e03Alpha_GJ/PF03229_13/1_4FoP_duplication/PF13865_6/13GRP/PF07172_11/2_3e02GRP/PF07172_11/2_8_NODE_910_length_2431_cov_269_025920_g717_i0372148
MRAIFQLCAFAPLLLSEAARSRPAGILGDDDNPLVTVYAENWGVWARGMRGSNIDKMWVNRDLPYRKLAINHAFSLPDANDCILRTTDNGADFDKEDPGYGYPGWGGPWNGPQVAGLMGSLMTLKRARPEIILLPSLGGWSRSHTFHTCIQPGKREAFADSIIRHVKYLGFDGVDLDWEYPSCEGGCGCQGEEVCHSTPNVGAHGDWDTYKDFLTYLRQRLDAAGDEVGKYLYITMALGMNPDLLQGKGKWDVPTPFDFLCAPNSPVDWMNLMTYDYFGPWAQKTGPLSPLRDTPSVSEDDDFHIQYGLDYIKNHCQDMSRLTMGLATYGKIWRDVPKQGNPPGLWQTSTSGNWRATGTWEAGTVSIWDILKNYRGLCSDNFDEVSETATMFCDRSPKNEPNVFVSYEDGETWRRKMAMARQYGMSGAIIWAASDMSEGANNVYDASPELLSGLFSGWQGRAYSIPPMKGVSSYTQMAQWKNYPCPGMMEGTSASACANLGAPEYTFPSDESVNLAGSSGVRPPPSSTSSTSSTTSTTTTTTTTTTTPSPSLGPVVGCQAIISSDDAFYTADCQSKCTYYHDTGYCHCTSVATAQELASCVSSIHSYCRVTSGGGGSGGSEGGSGSGGSEGGSGGSGGGSGNIVSDCKAAVKGTQSHFDSYCDGLCADYAPSGSLTLWCPNATAGTEVAACVVSQQPAACQRA